MPHDYQRADYGSPEEQPADAQQPADGNLNFSHPALPQLYVA
jgi:hypothetical protein